MKKVQKKKAKGKIEASYGKVSYTPTLGICLYIYIYIESQVFYFGNSKTVHFI